MTLDEARAAILADPWLPRARTAEQVERWARLLQRLSTEPLRLEPTIPTPKDPP